MTEEPSKPAEEPAQSAAAPGPAAAAGAMDPGRPGHAGHTAAFHHNLSGWTLRNALWVGFFLLLTVATRCANFQNVFAPARPGGPRQVYFLVGDCYARMTRVRMILEHGGMVHYHAFENFPAGVWPHTTAPMDYLIVALALLLKPFTADYIDLAGAVVAPLLGLLTTGFLALWARELNQQYRRSMLLLAALSPILVHGTCLGRPDHHPLQIFLLTVGLGAELIMARAPCVSWGIVSGAAWGLALWVSLYEPLVLMVVVFVTKVVFYRSNLFTKERLWGLGLMAAILLAAWLLEGRYLARGMAIEMVTLYPGYLPAWLLHWLEKACSINPGDPLMKGYFDNWMETIQEMQNVESIGASPGGSTLFWDLLYRWVGFGLLASPLLLIARLRDTKRSVLLLSLLVTTFILTMMQVRWGYFFALVYVMSLPWQLSLFKRRWVVWTLFLLSLWPVARQWDDVLFGETYQEMSAAQLSEQRCIRQAAEFIGAKAPGGILAPWWWSPQLAYWSGQPALAGSSHESLPGIVETSRFFSATDPKMAEAICDRRQVETVVTGQPGEIVNQAVQVLGQPLPETDNTMADILWEKPSSAPMFLHVVLNGTVVKVFEVNHGSVTYR